MVRENQLTYQDLIQYILFLLITRRSLVRIQPPLPRKPRVYPIPVKPFFIACATEIFRIVLFSYIE